MPEITLSLPAVIGLLSLFLIIGAVLVYLALNQTASAAVEPTASPTLTLTPTLTPSPTAAEPTATHTPLPSPTPLSYTVQLGDTCGSIAFSFDVSIQSIVLMNNLPADCSTPPEHLHTLALKESDHLLTMDIEMETVFDAVTDFVGRYAG